jgi:hypothetical protein
LNLTSHAREEIIQLKTLIQFALKRKHNLKKRIL